jgi:5,10-methylenetetrahydromethanopterin reductase
VFSTGVGLFPTESATAIRELTLLAESLGYDNVWFGDSQNIWRESSVTMGAAAVGTSRVVLGTGVTNALTRHPSLLASTWATLHELTGGRAALGIGTGDSSLRTMGLRPLKLAELEAAVSDLRALLRGEAVTESTSGEQFHLNYLDAPAEVPIYVAASAPRILELSGRIADGTIVLVGVSPTFIEAALELIDKGARAAGATRADRHVVLWTPTAISDDPVQARDLARAHVARVCIRPLPAPVDDAMQAAIERVKSSYDYYHHMDTAANHADLVPDDLVDLFALAGTPQECEERLRAIADLEVDQVAIVPFELPGQSRERTIRLFADIVARL